MKAVIVAAGLSTRMYPVVRDMPKCMLEVGGKPIIRGVINQLTAAGINEIGVVVGYNRGEIEEEIMFDKEVTIIYNPFYEQCNNMASLWFAKDFINKEPFIYIHGDLLFDTKILTKLLDAPEEDFVVIDTKECDKEDMKVVVTIDGNIIDYGKEIELDRANGEWIGMAKFYRPDVLFNVIEYLLESKELYAYDVVAFAEMGVLGYGIRPYFITGLQWIEIDFPKEYELACQMNWK